MTLRDTINKSPAVGAVVAVVLIGATALVFWWLNRAPPIPPAPTQQWFCDLGDKSLFLVSISEVPPIAAPSKATGPDGGTGGVKAHVFSCGSCADKATRFTGYLESFSPEAQEAMQATRNPKPGAGRPQGAAMAAAREGRLVADANATEWVGVNDEKAGAITSMPDAKCAGKAVECWPPPSSGKP